VQNILRKFIVESKTANYRKNGTTKRKTAMVSSTEGTMQCIM
jgi:hypothetical protein